MTRYAEETGVKSGVDGVKGLLSRQLYSRFILPEKRDGAVAMKPAKEEEEDPAIIDDSKDGDKMIFEKGVDPVPALTCEADFASKRHFFGSSDSGNLVTMEDEVDNNANLMVLGS